MPPEAIPFEVSMLSRFFRRLRTRRYAVAPGADFSQGRVVAALMTFTRK
jgi:hypothetical protein